MGQHTHKPTSRGPAKTKAGSGASYRGVELQTPPGRSRFTDAQLRKAVDSAIEKNRHVLTGKR